MLLDESGFRLQPGRRLTWAARGPTPIHYSWDRVAFLGYLRRHLGRKRWLVWDRWSGPRAATPCRAQRYGRAITFEWRPPYAPDLNPTEQVWNHAKYVALADFIPHDVADLDAAAADSFPLQHHNASLVASFFKLAKLEC